LDALMLCCLIFAMNMPASLIPLLSGCCYFWKKKGTVFFLDSHRIYVYIYLNITQTFVYSYQSSAKEMQRNFRIVPWPLNCFPTASRF
jgi:hypothetical protein